MDLSDPKWGFQVLWLRGDLTSASKLISLNCRFKSGWVNSPPGHVLVCLQLLLYFQVLMNPYIAYSESLYSHLQKEELSPKYTTCKDDKEMTQFRSHPKLFFSDPNCNKDWGKKLIISPSWRLFSSQKSNTRKLAEATWKRRSQSVKAKRSL